MIFYTTHNSRCNLLFTKYEIMKIFDKVYYYIGAILIILHK